MAVGLDTLLQQLDATGGLLLGLDVLSLGRVDRAQVEARECLSVIVSRLLADQVLGV